MQARDDKARGACNGKAASGRCVEDGRRCANRKGQAKEVKEAQEAKEATEAKVARAKRKSDFAATDVLPNAGKGKRGKWRAANAMTSDEASDARGRGGGGKCAASKGLPWSRASAPARPRPAPTPPHRSHAPALVVPAAASARPGSSRREGMRSGGVVSLTPTGRHMRRTRMHLSSLGARALQLAGTGARRGTSTCTPKTLRSISKGPAAVAAAPRGDQDPDQDDQTNKVVGTSNLAVIKRRKRKRLFSKPVRFSPRFSRVRALYFLDMSVISKHSIATNSSLTHARPRPRVSPTLWHRETFQASLALVSAAACTNAPPTRHFSPPARLARDRRALS